MSELVANFNRIIVKELEPKEVTKGGLVIPDTAKEKPNKGIIVSIGKIPEDEVTKGLEIGATVHYGKYAGVEVEFEDKKYKVIENKDILCIEL